MPKNTCFCARYTFAVLTFEALLHTIVKNLESHLIDSQVKTGVRTTQLRVGRPSFVCRMSNTRWCENSWFGHMLIGIEMCPTNMQLPWVAFEKHNLIT